MLAEQITLQHSIEVEESAKPRFTREYILKYAQIVMYPTNRAPRACVQMVNPNIKDISCMFIVPVVHEDKTTTMTSLLWDDIEPIHLEPEEILDTVVRKPSKFVIKKLDSLLGCKSEEQSSDLYVITNREKRFGASSLLYGHLWNNLFDTFKENLYILPASQTRDKDALTREGVAKVLDDLKAMDFEFIVCDSPAGIETGALMALYFADEAIITTNPEVSSVRDSDRILGILASKSRRAENGEEPIKEHLLLTRYNPGRVSRGDMLSMEDVLEILRIKLVGVIPEDQSVLRASNQGEPVILDINADAGKAYADTVERLLGEERPFRFIEEEKKGFLKRLFGG